MQKNYKKNVKKIYWDLPNQGKYGKIVYVYLLKGE